MPTQGEKIAKLRKSLSLTQSQLAEEVGVHPVTVSKWEAGSQKLSGDNLVRVAKKLGVTVEALSDINENVSRENAGVAPGPIDSDPFFWREYRAIQESGIPELWKALKLEALTAAIRQLALARAEGAAVIRAQIMAADTELAGQRQEVMATTSGALHPELPALDRELEERPPLRREGKVSPKARGKKKTG